MSLRDFNYCFRLKYLGKQDSIYMCACMKASVTNGRVSWVAGKVVGRKMRKKPRLSIYNIFVTKMFLTETFK